MKTLSKLIVTAILATAALTASAQFDIKSWQYQSKIDVSADAKNDYVLLDIPSVVFEKLNPNLSDLRVVNEDGEVPYFAATENEKNYSTDLPSRMYNLGTILGQSTSFEIDLGQEGLNHSSVTINTPSENFKRSVQIFGSNDTKDWRLLNDKGQIFDYTNKTGEYINSRFATISYPEGTWRYLKVVISDQGEAPLDITGAKVARDVKEKAKEISYTPTFTATENTKDKTTDIVADLGLTGVPHSKGELLTDSEIFSRGVIIYDSSDAKSWTAIGNGYIFSIDTPKFAGKNLKFSYPESRKRYIKIAIQNQDDKPLNVSGVTLSGIVRNIFFKYSDGKHYTLYMGNPKATSPVYDIEKLAQYINMTGLSKATLGPIEQSKDYVAPVIPLTESSPYILPAFLTLIVVVLLFFVARLFMITKK